MSLKPCRSCGHQISTSARQCPSCGHRPTSPVTWFVAAFLCLIIYSCVSHNITSARTRAQLRAQTQPRATPTASAIPNPQSAMSTPAATPQSAIPNPQSPMAIGDTVSCGNFVYTVISADTVKLPVQPNAMFLAVTIATTNLDKQPRMIPFFNLIDSQGRRHQENIDHRIHLENYLAHDDLNPDVTHTGSILFDVPPGETYTLRVSGSYLSTSTALITLGTFPQ